MVKRRPLSLKLYQWFRILVQFQLWQSFKRDGQKYYVNNITSTEQIADYSPCFYK